MAVGCCSQRNLPVPCPGVRAGESPESLAARLGALSFLGHGRRPGSLQVSQSVPRACLGSPESARGGPCPSLNPGLANTVSRVESLVVRVSRWQGHAMTRMYRVTRVSPCRGFRVSRVTVARLGVRPEHRFVSVYPGPASPGTGLVRSGQHEWRLGYQCVLLTVK